MRRFCDNLKLILKNIISYIDFAGFFKIVNIAIFLFSQIITAEAYATNQTDIPYLVPDGSTNTTTDRSENGTPIVNIAPPNQAGVSFNNWNSYNVTSENQILNNAKGATVDTQLAGQIYGNPKFNADGVNPATIIINQDLSHQRSSINGAIEVAGSTKAELVIANGNGFDIKGATFINIPRVSIVTGYSNINPQTGNIDNFKISNQSNSNIIISGDDIPNYKNLGINLDNGTSLDIVSREVQIMADIQNKGSINISLGNSVYDYQTKNIDSDSMAGSLNKPLFAIDSSAVGGMYAGLIKIITTEDGAGVRLRGDLVSATNIDLNSVANIEYERADAKNNINIASNKGNIVFGKYSSPENLAITRSLGDINLIGSNGIELNDSSQANNFYATGSIFLNSKNNLVKNNASIKAEKKITIDSTSFENNSLVFSLDDIAIKASNLFNNQAGKIEAIKSIAVNSGSFVNSSLIKAGNDATLTSTGSFTDTNQIKATGNLSITASTGIAYYDLYSGGNLSLINNASGDINHNYKSYSIGTTTIGNDGGNIVFGLTDNSNSGSLYSKGNLTIATSLNVTNNSDIFSEAKINLTAQNLTNNMHIMAIGNSLVAGTGLNDSDLIVNLDSNLTNHGLLFATNNINLNVNGIVTNDGTYSAEIFALNGNVNINGKLYNTPYGNISKYDLFALSFDKVEDIWNALIGQDYIDNNGKISDKFKESLLVSSDTSNLFSISNPSLGAYKDAIYNILTGLSMKLVQSGNSSNSLDQITRNFDAKAKEIYGSLQKNGYLDDSGKVLQKFYTDTQNVGASGLVLGDDKDIIYLKNDIYQLLQDARTGSVIENTFLGISGLDGGNLSRNLINELRAKKYIDADGNVTLTFPANADDLAINLSSDFTPYKQVIFDQINATKLVNKASEDKFNSIAYNHLNSINNYETLFAKLVSDGYILDGKLTDKFTQAGNVVQVDPVTDTSGLINYKKAVENIFGSKAVGSSVSASDFTSVAYLSVNNITNASQLYTQLQAEGFIDDKGNIAEKFYTDGISSSTSSLANYQGGINSAISGIAQAKLTDSSFRKITKPLDNSAERLVSELIQYGYLDESGKKTANFNFANVNAFATAFPLVATNGEYEVAKTAIFNALSAKNDTYSFKDSDFLGTVGEISFDENVLYNENQILMKNLIDNNYISKNGDVKSGFYSLSNDYQNLNLDNRFSALKAQIGALLKKTSPVEVSLETKNLVNIVQSSAGGKAGEIFQQLFNNGYINIKGDFSQKLADEVINYSGDDKAKISRLNIGEYSNDYAFGVYQKLKEIHENQSSASASKGIQNGVEVKSFASKILNLNGGKITTSLGDINIKALAFENVAKDIVGDKLFDPLNPESAIIRTPYRGINSAWKNTVLYGYDKATSILDSKQSSIKAGNIIKIEANSILNNSSLVSAGKMININADNLNNGRTGFEVIVPYIYQTHWKKCKWSGCKSARYENWYSSKVPLVSNTPSIISSGALNIVTANNINIDSPVIDYDLAKPTQESSNPSKPTSSVWKIEAPTANNGLFRKASPDSKYLIESSYGADDPNRLTGSAYYKSRFGFDPNQNNIKWLGDPFYEWNAINQQILQITKKQQNWNEWALSNGIAEGSDWQANINKLIDNAYNQKTALDLAPGVKLTEAQINALKQDIVWYEEETVKMADGSTQKVAVPHVYLAKNSLSKINLNSSNPGESVLLANNINIKTGGNVSNYGRILATADSKQPAGTSGNLTIISSGDITNKSTIKADNSVKLSADGNIVNSSTVNSITIDHNGGTDVFSNIAKTAAIEAGNIYINAGKGFENLAAQIKVNKNDLGNGNVSSGNLNISAGGDINISTIELKNRIETRWGDSNWGNSKKSGHSIIDQTNNIASEITAISNISLDSRDSDINIQGSNLSSGVDLNLVAKNNINITSLQNSSYSLTETHKKGMMSSKQSKDMEQQTRNISSNLEAGNSINIKSGSDTNIIASNLTAVNSGNITVGSYLDATTNAEIINNEAVINILSAKDSDYKYRYASSTKIDVGAIAVGMAAGALTGPVGLIAGAYIGSQAKKGQINTSEKYDETIISSNLNFGNSLNLRSASDTNIISSNLSTNSGDLNIITGSLIDKNNNLVITDKTANLNIGVDKEVHYSNSTQEKFGGDYATIVAGAIIAGAVATTPMLGISGVGVAGIAGNSAQRTNVSSNSSRQENLISSNINVADSSLLKSQNNINIIASNYSNGADATILANNQVNLISGQETSSSSNSSGHSGGFSSVSELNQVDKIKQKSTNLTIGGDLAIVSGSDTNIIASNIYGQGNATIIAGKYLDEDNFSATYNQEIYNKDASVNILNAKNITTTLNESKRSGIEFSDDYAKMAVGYAIAGPVGLAMTALEANKYKDITGGRTEEIIQSNLTFGKSINIASASDLNVRSSNLSAGVNPNTGLESGNQGNVNLIAGLVTTANYNNGSSTANTNDKAKINITSDTENNYSYTVSEKSGIGGSNMDLSNDGLTFAQINRNTSTNASSTQVASNINSSNGNINLISQDDLKIVASNVNAVLNSINQANANLGNVNLISDHGNVDIISAYNTNYSASDSFHAESNINFEINSREIALTAGADGNGSSTTTNAGQVVSSNIVGAKVNMASGIASSYGSGLADPQNNSDKGNINIVSSNFASTRDAVTLITANDVNLLTSSNFYEETNSSYDFSAHVKAGISYNFKDVWKSIEDLKDVDPKNALKYIAINSVANYLGAGAVSPYLATYGPALLSMGEGDNLDESLAENSKYINDANTINNAGKGGSGSAGITIELAYSQQKSWFKQSDVVSNSIFSNSDINLTSAVSDLKIHSSNLSAENNINLNATKGDINILADTNNSDSFARSFAITASIPLYGKGGAGSIAFSKSKSKSEDYINSSLVAGNQFNLNSANDTNIISSNILASKVNMLIAGDLNLESRQNTSDSKATSFSLGGGFSSSGGGKSGSGNISYSKSVSDRDWVDNQASILGTDSVAINVGKNTNLVGSVIANITNANELGLGSTLLGGSESTRSATMGGSLSNGIDGGNLTLNTNTISYSNLYDSDFARSFGIGVGINARTGGSGGSGAKGSGSLTLDYSMHDFEQTTNAVIGSGNIKTGTTLNLDSNNNLIAVAGGTDYSGDLNRNIFESQVLTKSLTVDPIHIKETFEFGRNSTTAQKKADSTNNSKSSGDNSNASTIVDNSKNSLSYKVGVTLFGEENKNLVNAIVNNPYLTQINPLRGFGNIFDGITSDLRNIKTELNIDSIAVNTGPDAKYLTIDKNGNKTEFTLEQLRNDPSLASTKVFSNGVMNTESEALGNALEQLGGYDKNGRITIAYDPTVAPEATFTEDWKGNTKGFFADMGEVLVNYAGAGIFVTNVQKSNQEFLSILTDSAKETGETINLAGHSAGGRRNYLTLLNSNPNQYLNSNGQSVLQVQFSGTPANNQDLMLVAQMSGAEFVRAQNKTPSIANNPLADPVGIVLGGNGNILDTTMAGVGAGFLFSSELSPHSHYGCAFGNCDPITRAEIGKIVNGYKLKNTPTNP